MTSGRVSPPWTTEQVDALNSFQVSGTFHPFTCGRCRDRLGIRFRRQDDGTLSPVPFQEWPRPDELDDEGWKRYVIDDHLLVAAASGWTCPTCDYTQDWAWDWMADRERWTALDWCKAPSAVDGQERADEKGPMT